MNRLVNIVDEYVSDKLNYLDFANLVMRQQMYKNQESEEYGCGGHCKCVEE